MLLSSKLTRIDWEIQLNSPLEATLILCYVSFAHYQMQTAPNLLDLENF